MMRASRFFNLLAIASTIGAVLAFDDIVREDGMPEKKLISTFQIVRFPNDACESTNTRNGTCYTSAECSDKGGSSAGSCADGFGVCCIFVVSSCGQTTMENITYWEDPSDTAYISTDIPTSCQLKVCPISDNICQLRIDFLTFVITGPSSSTFSEAHHQLGTIPSAGLAGTATGSGTVQTVGNWKTNCLIDTFSVSGVSPSNSVPVLCGTVSATHMYVDADMDCNILNFNFMPQSGPAPDGALTVDSRGLGGTASRDWDMTIYQYECGYANAAPPGCTQYLWGQNTPAGTVSSWNHGALSLHLANQNQKICIRKERGRCYACFSWDGTQTNFEIGGSNGGTEIRTYPGQACGYGCDSALGGLGAAGSVCAGYDCVIIPGAFTVGNMDDGTVQAAITNIQTLAEATYQVPASPQITGANAFGVGAATSQNVIPLSVVDTAHTICTKHVPFQLTFKSDSFEGTGAAGEHIEGAGGQTGFQLNYELVNCVA